MKKRLIPEEGVTYGYLTFLKESERIVRPSRNDRAGIFVCICGKEVHKTFNSVLSGNTTSCGCMKGKSGILDITGERFGRLVATENTGVIKTSGYIWKCKCDCGNIVQVPIGTLRYGNTKSCGCLKVDTITTHGMSNTPTYKSWSKLLSRVRYEEYEEWHGDVVVDQRWDPQHGGSFENFLEDMGERPEGTTINRIRGAKLYSKDTCEWADLSMQSFDQKRSKVNTSGRTGVYQVKGSGRWVAKIKKNRKEIEVYRGDSFEDACEARRMAEIEYYGFEKE